MLKYIVRADFRLCLYLLEFVVSSQEGSRRYHAFRNLKNYTKLPSYYKKREGLSGPLFRFNFYLTRCPDTGY